MTRKILEVENVFFDTINENKSFKTSYIRLLNGVSVKFNSGRLTAIMGANGSGKSTLVNLIMGRVRNSTRTSGSINFNGDGERDPVEWTEKVAFLEQKEDYIKSLTVEEFLSFEIRFYRKDLKVEEQSSLLLDVMNKAGITHKRKEVIQDLSGGEIKKMMIADVLLQNAEVIFMDEPTSWLDSANATTFIRNMKELASKKQIIVVVIINQASQKIFNLFDDLIFIKPGGNLFYAGPVSEIDGFIKARGLKRQEGLPTHIYLYSLQSSSSDNSIPIEGSTPTNTIDSSVKVQSGLNRIFTGKGFSFTDVITILKRRLAYGYAENEFGIMFYVKLWLWVGVSYILQIAIGELNTHFIERLDLNHPDGKFETFLTSLKMLIVYSLFLNNYLSMLVCFAKNTSSTFLDKNEILTNDIFLGKYSTSSLYVASLIYDLCFRLLSMASMLSFLFVKQGQYMFHPWILCLTLLSILFNVIVHSVVSTIQRKYVYITIAIIMYLMFISGPEIIILRVFVMKKGYEGTLERILSYLVLSTLVINPANLLKLVWYNNIYSNEAYPETLRHLRKNDFFNIQSQGKLGLFTPPKCDIYKSFLGISCGNVGAYIIFTIITLSYVGVIYFLFMNKISPSIRLKLKN